MALNYDQVSVTTSATSIISSNTNEKVRKIENVGSATIFIGGANTVTATNGFPLNPGETLNISDYTGEVFGIVASGTVVASYIEEDFQ